jgi:hypothetical protein
LGWYLRTASDNETYGGHSGTAVGAYATMKMRYSDKVGVIYLWNENTMLLSHFHIKFPKEQKKIEEIDKLLFQKADEY